MAKDCIICGKRAGSKEHVFPAALGGRRINKGIYCAVHNDGFGPLAGLLSAQLKTINALLGVRGDHATAPHETIIVDEASGLEIRRERLSLRGRPSSRHPPGTAIKDSLDGSQARSNSKSGRRRSARKDSTSRSFRVVGGRNFIQAEEGPFSSSAEKKACERSDMSHRHFSLTISPQWPALPIWPISRVIRSGTRQKNLYGGTLSSQLRFQPIMYGGTLSSQLRFQPIISSSVTESWLAWTQSTRLRMGGFPSFLRCTSLFSLGDTLETPRPQ